MDLTIGIVNWNTAYHLDKCLNSIFKSQTQYKYQVYVVDNNSEDNSLKIIKRYKKIKLIQNKENIGMAASLNQIIKQTNSEYLLFLHPDTEISQDTIQKILDFMHIHPQIGIAGPKLVYPNNKIFLSCHMFPTITALLKENLGLNGLYMRKANHNKIQSVDIIASACIFIRYSALQQIGLFDEKFTNWMSEWDLAYRLKKQTKQKIVYAPITNVIHYETMSNTNLEYKKHSYPIADKMIQKLLLFYKKHYSWFWLIQLKKFIIWSFILKSIGHPSRARHYRKAIKTTITF